MSQPTILGKMELPDDHVRRQGACRCTSCNKSLPYGGEVFGDDVLCSVCADVWVGQFCKDILYSTDCDRDVTMEEYGEIIDSLEESSDEEQSYCPVCREHVNDCDCD